MSTDPREFEHPIAGPTPNELPTVLGVGSLTPEAIEAAEAGMYQRMTWASLHWNALDPDQQRELATSALTAAYPLMEAQAKAEALREAADALNTEAVGFQIGWSSSPKDVGKLDGIAQTRDWLRARAATIEGDKP